MKRKFFTHSLLTAFFALSFAMGASAQCSISSEAGSLSFTNYDFLVCPTITVTGYINDTDWGTIKKFLTDQGAAFSPGKVLDLSGATYTGSATGTTGVSTTYSTTSPTANASGVFTSVLNSSAYSLKLTGTLILPDNITIITGGFAYDTRVNFIANNVTMIGQSFYYYGYNDSNYTLDLAKMFPSLQYIIGSTAFQSSSTITSIIFPASFVFNDANYTPRLNNAIDNLKGTSGTYDNTTSVTSITIKNTEDPALGSSHDVASLLTKLNFCGPTKVYVPAAQLVNYQSLYPVANYPYITFVGTTTGVQEVSASQLGIKVLNRIISVTGTDSYEVYNVNGLKMNKLQPLIDGVYIVKSGNLTSKVFVK